MCKIVEGMDALGQLACVQEGHKATAATQFEFFPALKIIGTAQRGC